VEALINRAARLSRVELVRPKEAIGRNTTTNLQSGAIYGYAGLVEGWVERMQGELGGGAKVIATGGNAGLLTDVARSLERLDENLRLDGLRMLYEEARPSSSER
jgi:type III pantothenate kinase